MDMIVPQAPAAPASSLRTIMRFEGTASEYFKIWIVNLALTIVTLGIFSAWAKVRSRRYLYGNTYLGAHNFDYHADPKRILLGRAIAVGLFLAYSASVRLAPLTALFWIPAMFVAFPWLVRSSLRFNARNTSYRNIRFEFVGTYGGALKAFVLWWVLAAFTLFTTLPLAHRARDYYNINNHRFGGKAFAAQIPGKRLYAIYGMGLLLIIGAMIAAIVAVLLLNHIFPASGKIVAPAAMMATYFFAFFFVAVYIATGTFNLALNCTALDQRMTFEASLSPGRMIWIGASNLVAVLLTLGLLYPWARVRVARYRAEHVSLIGAASWDDFAGADIISSGVIGEEVASLFDIDLGL